MPHAIYFDCFSGISGDMALGALIDAGLPLDALRAELAKLQLDGWSIDAERGVRRYLSGTRALVDAPEQATHRHLSDVQAIVESSALAPELKQRALRVFTLLAEAEGQVHGIPPSHVHFHEVGALDAIVDIVGVVAGLALLRIDEVYASPLPLGSGWTRAAHGALPLPAPAVLALLAAAGAPTIPDDGGFELVTPTGAALLAGLAAFSRPPMRVQRVGYGLGARDLQRPNVLRVWLGETGGRGWGIADRSELNHPPSGIPHPLVLLETNIDDQPAEQLAYAVERLFELGALDAWLAPIQMKKGRSATLLSALMPAELEGAAVELIMRETTTLGIRRRPLDRHVAERELVSIDTPLGPVRVKRKRWNGEDLGAAPEYED
ncbi:MAG TPA: nickel pincer cofactor biosynthesis protein LarC, partial [Roseiflexaceae bacterium]|nr:nickel pincer cofactor biosynthesis protein LarC [Roseiflexaceae bacterium]